MTKNEKNEAAPQGGSTSQNGVLMNVKIEELKPHPLLSKLYKRDSDVSTLYESIKKMGLIHPVITNSKREVISGNRRVRALKMLGIKEITVEVVDLPEDKVLEFGITVNQSREKTIHDERNEVMSLFELYSEGQGKKNDGANTVKKISNITGMSRSKISSIRSIDEYAPEQFDEIAKGKSLNSAYDVAMTVKKRLELSKRLNKEYTPPKKDENIAELFAAEVKEICKKEAPEYVELIDNKQVSPKDAYNEVILKVDEHKRRKVEPKHECPFCHSNVETLKIQRLLNLGADQIEKLLQELKEKELSF